MTADSDRSAIGERVRHWLGASTMSKEAASREAGVSSITWTRIERGEPVRPDRLAAVLRFIERQEQEASPDALRDATDEQLIAELARRLAVAADAAAAESGGAKLTVHKDEPGDARVSASVARNRAKGRQIRSK